MKRFGRILFVLLFIIKLQTTASGQLNANRLFYINPVGGGIFFNTGYSFFNNQIGNYLTGRVCFNGGFEVTNKKWYYDFRVFNLEGKVATGLKDKFWQNGDLINAVMVGVDFGYTFVRLPKLFITPLIGIAHGHTTHYTSHDTTGGPPFFLPNASLKIDYNLLGSKRRRRGDRMYFSYDREYEHYMQITLTESYYPFGMKPSVGLPGSIVMISVGVSYYFRG